MNALKPLFDVVAEILATTDIPLRLTTEQLSNGKNMMLWYVGDVQKPTAGDFWDRFYFTHDDINEDELDRWVAELKTMLDDYRLYHDEGNECETGTSLEDDKRAENHDIDSQEHSHNKRSRT